jgi:hypothetical protein
MIAVRAGTIASGVHGARVSLERDGDQRDARCDDRAEQQEAG